MPLEKSGGRRQHGADHECRHDRQKERLRGVENGDDADDQECDQRKGDHLCAANDRRELAFAVRQRRTHRFTGKATFIGKDTQLALPALTTANVAWSREGGLRNGLCPAQNLRRREKFHRGNVSAVWS